MVIMNTENKPTRIKDWKKGLQWRNSKKNPSSKNIYILQYQEPNQSCMQGKNSFKNPFLNGSFFTAVTSIKTSTSSSHRALYTGLYSYYTARFSMLEVQSLCPASHFTSFIRLFTPVSSVIAALRRLKTSKSFSELGIMVCGEIIG